MKAAVQHLVLYTIVAGPLGAAYLERWAKSMMDAVPNITEIDVIEKEDGYTFMFTVEAFDALAAASSVKKGPWIDGLVTEMEARAIPDASDAHRHDSASQCSVHDSLA